MVGLPELCGQSATGCERKWKEVHSFFFYLLIAGALWVRRGNLKEICQQSLLRGKWLTSPSRKCRTWKWRIRSRRAAVSPKVSRTHWLLLLFFFLLCLLVHRTLSSLPVSNFTCYPWNVHNKGTDWQTRCSRLPIAIRNYIHIYIFMYTILELGCRAN